MSSGRPAKRPSRKASERVLAKLIFSRQRAVKLREMKSSVPEDLR